MNLYKPRKNEDQRTSTYKALDEAIIAAQDGRVTLSVELARRLAEEMRVVRAAKRYLQAELDRHNRLTAAPSTTARAQEQQAGPQTQMVSIPNLSNSPTRGQCRPERAA